MLAVVNFLAQGRPERAVPYDVLRAAIGAMNDPLRSQGNAEAFERRFPVGADFLRSPGGCEAPAHFHTFAGKMLFQGVDDQLTNML